MKTRLLESVIWITVLQSVSYETLQQMPRPYSELVAPPTAAPHPLAAIANQARQAVCDVYRWSGRNAVWKPEDIGLPNLFEPLMDMVCDLPGDPPSLPPARVDSGNAGQCACELYDATFQLTINGNTSTFTRTYFGPVSQAFEIVPQPDGTNVFRTGANCRGVWPNPDCVPPFMDVIVSSGNSSNKATLQRVVPSNVRPFTACNRPTLPLPTSPPGPPPLPPTIDVPRLPPLPPLTIPIFITPVLVRPEINFSPTINLDVGGINLTLSFDGWEFNFNPTFEGDKVLPPNQAPTSPPALPPVPPIYLPYPVNPPPSGGGGRDCCDEILNAIAALRDRVISLRVLTDTIKETLDGLNLYTRTTVKNLLDDIKECSCPPEFEIASSWTDVQDYQFQRNGDELLFALVLFTTPPIERKSYKTPGGVLVCHSGWFAFGRNRIWGDREDIDYAAKLCVASDRASDSFTFSLYTGLRCSGTLFRRKK